jgi:tryptophan synthase beta chain
VRSLHGAHLLRAEALPQDDDEHLGRRASTPSPSDRTNAGRQILAQDPDSPGSLGIAISEAVEVAATNDDAKYSLGSVLNHVLLHQTMIGQETIKQMEMAGDFPDIVIAPFGGGSNFAGISFPLPAPQT